MPLRSAEYHLEIVNSLANVSLAQNYYNPTDQFLEVEYNFPVSPDACIYRLTAQFGKTRVEGVVRDKEEAKTEYRRAVEEGRKAAFGEVSTQSKDIFVLRVGNIPPREEVTVEISYLQELSLSCNTFYQLQLIGKVSPRYLKYIP